MIKDCNRKFFAYGKFNYPRIKQRGGKQIKGDFFMKMTKKIFLAAIAVAAFAFTGCDALMGKLGEGTTTGFKWNKKMTVDGTDKKLYDESGVAQHAYRRFIKKIKANETVTNISTDIVIDTEKSDYHTDDAVKGGGNAVVGLAFDFHTSTDKSKYDFILVGFAPETKKFYIERYFDVASVKASTAADAMADDAEDLGSIGFDSSDSSMGPYYNFEKDSNGILQITNKKDTDVPSTYSDWYDLPANALVIDETAKTATVNVEVKQDTAGLYEIYIGGTKVAEYNGEVKIADDAKKNPGFAQGGVAVYANTPVGKTFDADKKVGSGTKVVVNYKSDKSKTNGLFEEDAE